MSLIELLSHRLPESRQDISCDWLSGPSRTERLQVLTFLIEGD